MTAQKIRMILEGAGCYADKVGKLSKGEHAGQFAVKHAFFYRHGGSSASYSELVAAALIKAGCTTLYVSGHEEQWRQWPGTSYFVAFVAVETPAAEDPNVYPANPVQATS